MFNSFDSNNFEASYCTDSHFYDNGMPLFTDVMMIQPENFSTFTNEMLNFNATPRKRNFGFISCEEDDFQYGKRKHLEMPLSIRTKFTPENKDYLRTLNVGYVESNGRVVLSCFIENCRFKTFETTILDQHLNLFHADFQCNSNGFCMICGKSFYESTIYNEVEHLHEHAYGIKHHFLACKQQIHVKEEFNMADETYISQNDTIVSDSGRDVGPSSRDLYKMDMTCVAETPTEDEKVDQNTKQILKDLDEEPPADDLNATVKIHYNQTETQGTAEESKKLDEPIFKQPKIKIGKPRKAKSSKVQNSKILQSEKTPNSPTADDLDATIPIHYNDSETCGTFKEIYQSTPIKKVPEQNSRKGGNISTLNLELTQKSPKSVSKTSPQKSQNPPKNSADIETLIKEAKTNFEFISIQNLYPWISEAITSTIFKTKSSVDILLNDTCLFSTYKCMNEICYFFTTDFEEFKKHSKSHGANNNFCCYCLKNFVNHTELCNHLELAHKFDRFQCNQCMYRSCQKGYVDVHQKFHHANDDNCEVFKSPVQKLLKSDRSKCLPTLQKNRDKFVMPYRCKTPRCKEIFFSKGNFRIHLESEGTNSNLKDFSTIITQQLHALEHNTASTQQGLYQCLHCQYGTDSLDIFDHMALNHPHEFAYACKRTKPQKLVEMNIMPSRESVENSTSIDYIGTTTTEAKSYDGNLEKLQSENLEKGK